MKLDCSVFEFFFSLQVTLQVCFEPFSLNQAFPQHSNFWKSNMRVGFLNADFEYPCMKQLILIWSQENRKKELKMCPPFNSKVGGVFSIKRQTLFTSCCFVQHLFDREIAVLLHCADSVDYYRWIIRPRHTNVSWFQLCNTVAGKAIRGKHVVLCSKMLELQNSSKRPHISHNTNKQHSFLC